MKKKKKNVPELPTPPPVHHFRLNAKDDRLDIGRLDRVRQVGGQDGNGGGQVVVVHPKNFCCLLLKTVENFPCVCVFDSVTRSSYRTRTRSVRLKYGVYRPQTGDEQDHAV